MFFGRDAGVKTPVDVVLRHDAVHPVFVGKRGIGDGEVKGFECAAREKFGAGDGVALFDFGGGLAVQNHVHFGQGDGGVVVFLPVDAETAFGFAACFQQQRA